MSVCWNLRSWVSDFTLTFSFRIRSNLESIFLCKVSSASFSTHLSHSRLRFFASSAWSLLCLAHTLAPHNSQLCFLALKTPPSFVLQIIQLFASDITTGSLVMLRFRGELSLDGEISSSKFPTSTYGQDWREELNRILEENIYSTNYIISLFCIIP